MDSTTRPIFEHTQGYFFGLEALDEKKTQVLFVHGAGGTPRDWKYLVEGMDRSRFQPWFFYYPSGLPLDRTGAILAQSIARVAASSRLHVERLVIVAHSMGGLVACSVINRPTVPSKPAYRDVHFASPYGGHMPRTLRSTGTEVGLWYDLEPGSPYLSSLATTTATICRPCLRLQEPAGCSSVPAVMVSSPSAASSSCRCTLQATRSYGSMLTQRRPRAPRCASSSTSSSPGGAAAQRSRSALDAVKRSPHRHRGVEERPDDTTRGGQLSEPHRREPASTHNADDIRVDFAPDFPAPRRWKSNDK
jgi:hypothetical protein